MPQQFTSHAGFFKIFYQLHLIPLKWLLKRMANKQMHFSFLGKFSTIKNYKKSSAIDGLLRNELQNQVVCCCNHYFFLTD